MRITRQYLQFKPWTALCEMINDKHNVILYPQTTRLVSLKALSEKRIETKIAINRSSSIHNQLPDLVTDTYQYDRLSLSEFFKVSPVLEISKLTLPLTTLDVFEALGEINGIVFDTRDFIHNEYTEYGKVYTVKAHSESLRWYGTIDIRFNASSKVDIGLLGKVRDFPLVGQPDNIEAGDGLINGSYYVTGYDFTQYRDSLRHIERLSPNLSAKRLATLLKLITGFPFNVSDNPGKHNIKDTTVDELPMYKVIYNGIVLSRFTPRVNIENVLVIQLNPTYCTDLVGTLLIHYN